MAVSNMWVSDRDAQDSPGVPVAGGGAFVAAAPVFVAARHGGHRGR
jgi:hypothetical protein